VDVNETNRRQPAVSPSTTYVLMTATIFLTVGLALVSLVYLRTRQNPQVAVTPAVTSSPTPSPSPAGSPTPAATATPKPAPTTKPEDDLESGLIQPTDPLEDAIRSAKEKVTPAPDPYIVPSRERTVSSPTPRPTIYTESLVYASDILVPRYSKSEERRVYRFHLSQTARVKGNFSARGNISVYITGGNYSSNGAISSDSIDVSLAAGTYEVIVSARETVSFSVHLTAYYDQ
jgi:hypothetical protein